MEEDIVEIKKALEEALSVLESDQYECLKLVNLLRDKLVTAVSRSKKDTSNLSEFDELASLVNKSSWPLAVPISSMCDPNSEADKESRADGYIQLILDNYTLNKKKFLDFGCGEGHFVKSAKQYGASVAVGYDIVSSGKLYWENESDYLLTTDFSKVTTNGPYDVISMCDVMDHIDMEEPAETLSKVKSLMHKDSVLIVRCHPWCSRHGGHLYTQLNKAYIHLIFTEEELNLLGVVPDTKIHKIIYPINTYKKAFQLLNFHIETEDVEKDAMEDFFYMNPKIRDRIRKHWSGAKDESARAWPKFQLEQAFVTFTLTLK